MTHTSGPSKPKSINSALRHQFPPPKWPVLCRVGR